MIVAAKTFKALGDPTRLEMIERLSSGSMQSLTSLTKDLGLTRQGARKHLDVLVGADMVTVQPIGRSIQITFHPESLGAVQNFIKDLEQKWDMRLKALKSFAESTEERRSDARK